MILSDEILGKCEFSMIFGKILKLKYLMKKDIYNMIIGPIFASRMTKNVEIIGFKS